MTMKILFLYAYGLVQLNVISIGKTITASASISLFLVGALFCLPIAYILQTLVTYYAGHAVFANALIEETVKAAPVAYLLWRTKAGLYAGLLDGLLCGAAIGAGFGFAEDAIYTIENAALPRGLAAAYPGWSDIIFAWLPGGWSGYGYFPGHAVLTAIVGAGLAAAGRLGNSVVTRALLAGLPLAWVICLHASFNLGSSGSPSIPGAINAALSGTGAFAKGVLLAIVLTFVAMEWRIAFQSILPGNAGRRPLRQELSELSTALRTGLASGAAALRLFRLRCELANLQWWPSSGAPAGTAELQARARRHAALIEDAARTLSMLPAAGSRDALAARLAPGRLGSSLRLQLERTFLGWPAIPDAKQVRVASLSVPGLPANLPIANLLYGAFLFLAMLQGLYLVFVSPSLNHSLAQTIGATWIFLWVGIAGQVVVAWRCLGFLLGSGRLDEPPGTSEGIKSHCRRFLAIGGLLSNALAWKTIYDRGAFPYPFRPGDVESTVNQFRACYGQVPASASVGPLTTPIPPALGSGEGEESDRNVLFGGGAAGAGQEAPADDEPVTPPAQPGAPPVKPARSPLNLPLGDDESPGGAPTPGTSS